MIPEATALLVLVLLVTGTGLVVGAVLAIILRGVRRSPVQPAPPVVCPGGEHREWRVLDVHTGDDGTTHVLWGCGACLETGVAVA